MVISRKQRGFTLIELLIVISIILILVSLSIPTYKQSILRAKETVLKDDLFTLRRTIDEYTYDKKKAPAALDDLVTDGYLKQIPKDPMTGKADWNPIMEADASFEGTEIGIDDIHSSSDAMGSDGAAYSTW
jgi:general secretion pathway protein G